MLKKTIVFIVLLSMILTLSSCKGNSSQTNSSNENKTSKIKVAVSFNAMREFVSAIGKDKVDITTIVPNGTEPHEFDPKIKDLQTLSTAKVFVYNGLGMEKWADKAVQSVDNKDLIAVDASKGADAIKNSDPDEIKEHGEYDPHLWISLKGAEFESNNIKDALVKADPKNKDFYEKNYTDFKSQLDGIYNDYKSKLSNLPNKNFVTGHAAFAYLCRDFGLKQNSVEDVFAEGEPSSKRLEELISYCKTNNIKTIFVEDMVSPKVSNTLAKEVNAKVEKIYTVESKEDNLDYIQSMKQNLQEIYNSLK
ncbi:metal ABC transporter substrate-binding protein [Clostridium arbusti]|uniref:metal ABC transporter substrate-binding protein n=1 Tax=Clostridium arbusti TaxID=1137848 RepID=UPI000288F9D7|nr:metal ABC transporter substrate-binding protein [Clostridium arbusti]